MLFKISRFPYKRRVWRSPMSDSGARKRYRTLRRRRRPGRVHAGVHSAGGQERKQIPTGICKFLFYNICPSYGIILTVMGNVVMVATFDVGTVNHWKVKRKLTIYPLYFISWTSLASVASIPLLGKKELIIRIWRSSLPSSGSKVDFKYPETRRRRKQHG